MTHIGEPVRKVEDVPRPIRVPRIEPRPDREPVPVRTIPQPQTQPSRVTWENIGMEVEKIPYECPYDGRPLVLNEEVTGQTILSCPEHGVIYEG